MISPVTVPAVAPRVPRTAKDSAHLADVLRADAAIELGAAFEGVSGERINCAAFPGLSRHGVSRAINGDSSNPLYRLAAMFVLMRRLGMSRARAQRLVDYLQEIVDRVWPPEEEHAGRDQLIRKEQEIDGEEDRAETDMLLGIDGAESRWLNWLRMRRAHDHTLILHFGGAAEPQP